MKKFIALALLLCLAFALSACAGNEATQETTAADTTATATTAAATEEATAAETEAATEAAFTEDDALEMVKSTYTLEDGYFFTTRGTYEVEGGNYYAIDMRKSLDTNSTYISTYFVATNGSEIVEGFIEGETPIFANNDNTTLDINEENAVKAVEAAYDFDDDCYLIFRGVEEIDGVSYYAVDLRKSLETNTTYLSSYFVTYDGTIVEGYYRNNTPYLAK